MVPVVDCIQAPTFSVFLWYAFPVSQVLSLVIYEDIEQLLAVKSGVFEDVKKLARTTYCFEGQSE